MVGAKRMKINQESDEFVITYSNKKKLNIKIAEFRRVNPDYEVFNISSAGVGGGLGGTISFYIIWKRRY